MTESSESADSLGAKPDFLRSPEWLELMRGSVVTEDGRSFPESDLKRVFHGTRGQFDFFETEHIGKEMGLHAGSAPVAEAFTRSENKNGKVILEGRMYPLYLNIKRPLWMGDTRNWRFDRVSKLRGIAAAVAQDLYLVRKVISQDEINRMKGDVVYSYDWSDRKLRAAMHERYGDAGVEFLNLFLRVNVDARRVKSRDDLLGLFSKYGYDGIAYFNEAEARQVGVEVGKDISYIALYPEQVRSAITGEQVWER